MDGGSWWLYVAVGVATLLWLLHRERQARREREARRR